MMRPTDKFERFFWIWFAVCAAGGLAMTGVIIWAIIKLVGWVTMQ